MNLAADRAGKLRRQARAILAIVLHHLVGLPIEEVAQTLRVPAGTVKSLLSRGRRALAARLGEAEEVLDRP
jgi:DNA-directed RNA polymerase specialized sigma24 family protein